MESWLECSEAQSFRRHLITEASLSSRGKHSLMILRSMWISFPEAPSYPRLPAGSVGTQKRSPGLSSREFGGQGYLHSYL